MKIRWTDKAVNDTLGIYDYISERSEIYANAIFSKIRKRPDPQLIDHPLSGSVVPEFNRGDIREVFVHSFRIIYVVLSDEIRILTVIHGSSTLSLDPDDAG